MMFPRNDAGAKLRDVMNTGITRLEATGRMAELRSTYELADPPVAGHRRQPPESDGPLRN